MDRRAIGVIPARYGSTRLPAKALALLDGRPMIQHVYERARKAKLISELIVATDHELIVKAVEQVGGKAVMTDPALRSGTDRVAEVARQHTAEVVINIQGDEPIIRGEQIDQLAEFLLAHQAVPMATLMTRLPSAEDAGNPNVVKVVVDRDGYALYFSRSAIPFVRDAAKANGSAAPGQPIHWKHLGIYGSQRHFLLRFPTLPPTPLEQAEQLEQLRALEHGQQIMVLETPFDTISVDTAADLEKVGAWLAKAGPAASVKR